ncbi:MAG: 5'-methylthioadenosine/S-adenosylhomocysteine nucleosidase [Clostridiales bacterium]|nr:5'-methylthioadenosine/S-adenosylhomocysteine nucleosidase [Clostridiales bacterium]
MTILIQGAMDIELDVLKDYFKPTEVRTINGYEFCLCEYRGNKIIISKTEVGIINATIATTIGIYEFRPELVINQGCAGSHRSNIHRGDLIIGEKAAYINNFRTRQAKLLGEGSDSLSWRPSNSHSYVIGSTPIYVELAERVEYAGKKYIGVIGSGDLFSKEVDRINYIHSLFGELSEDMESVATMKVCDSFNIDKIALRIISNNEITNESFDGNVCRTLQQFVIPFIDKIIAR